MKKLFLLWVCLCGNAFAQDYPVREIRSICNFAAGSGADIVVRYYSDRLSRLAGKPVIVDNKPGAQGLVATDFTAKSKPDGYTLMITPASSTLAIAPHMFKKLPFDPVKDFMPVTTLFTTSFTISVNPDGPHKTFQDLVTHLRAKPGNGFYGTQSNSGQVSAELFKAALGLDTGYVPFKITGDAFTNLLNGNIDFMSVDATWAGAFHPARVRILAVTSAKRNSSLPDVPTLKELGLGDIDVSPWWGVVVAAGTPPAIVAQLAAWFNQVAVDDDTRQFLARQAADPFPGSPESMAALVKSDIERWARYVKLAKIEPQ